MRPLGGCFPFQSSFRLVGTFGVHPEGWAPVVLCAIGDVSGVWACDLNISPMSWVTGLRPRGVAGHPRAWDMYAEHEAMRTV